MKKLKEIFPQWLTNGAIFKAFNDFHVGVIPWSELNALQLDINYLGNRSGDKPISPLVEKLLSSDGTLSQANLKMLSQMIWQKYSVNWTRLYDILSLEYNPIENYSMKETHTGTETDTDTPSNWKETKTDTPTNWKTTTEALAADNGGTTESQVFGFNSSSAVDTGKVTTTNKENREVEQSGTYQSETSRTGTYEKETEYDTELKRSGNIGVTTSQQMIESEKTLWSWNVWEQIFRDIDKELTLNIYE